MVNPQVLVWARETAALTLEAAAKKLGMSDDSLRAIESGEKHPSRSQVEKFSNVYHRSSIVFYLDEPPSPSRKMHDFRSSRVEMPPEQDARLAALVRDIKARQAILKMVLEEEEEAEHLDFVASMEMDDGVEAVVKQISSALEFEPGTKCKNADDLFKKLRNCTESLGVFVLLVSDLGSHHSSIDPVYFRGLAAADPMAPLIALNDRDARTARPFTLLHELAHIWIGASGVSGPQSDVEGKSREAKIEEFCNDVAARFLLPADAFSVRETLQTWMRRAHLCGG